MKWVQWAKQRPQTFFSKQIEFQNVIDFIYNKRTDDPLLTETLNKAGYEKKKHQTYSFFFLEEDESFEPEYRRLWIRELDLIVFIW